jgi:N-acetylmuramoyl-L-alanine amidase
VLEIIRDFIPQGRKNRPAKKMVPEWLCLHDTANANAKADAAAHAKYLRGDSAANAQVSWHFTVDDKRAVQHLPLDETAYHAGDGGSGPGNTTSIGIEICENADGDRSKAEANAAELIISLLRQFGFGVDRIVPHKRWTGKNCPHLLLPRWDAFIEGIRRVVEPTPPPVDAPTNDSSQPSVTVNLIGAPQCTAEQAARWARSRGATEQFVNLAGVYWKEGASHGVRADVAYAQSAKETAFGRFGGVIDPTFHNWCGLKTRDGGGNDDPNAHAKFPSDEVGVLAHVQHLCKYAGQPLLQGEEVVDPRYSLVSAKVTCVEELGGRWAPSPNYGVSIVRDYLQPMLAYESATVCPKCQALVARFQKAEALASQLLGVLREC